MFVHETDPTSSDSDGDRLSDELEVTRLGTDPTTDDSDGDGVKDGDEDLDRDGFSVLEELDILLTDPVDSQSAFVPRVRISGSTHTLGFPTISGRTYR
ncbi:MAG: hypothetical protein GWO24_33955, partial [Akkermansiaceae bacterium]|nr:hypothetical protein [Akkermansiaceae bacterium]